MGLEWTFSGECRRSEGVKLSEQTTRSVVIRDKSILEMAGVTSTYWDTHFTHS